MHFPLRLRALPTTSIKPALPYLSASFTILIWGATPAVTQVAVSRLDPATVGVLRTVIAALVLLPLGVLLRVPRPADRGDWLALIVNALVGFAGYTILVSLGVKLTSTAHTALILASSPVFTGLVGFTVSRHWPRATWWIGALIALSGEAILIIVRSSASGPNAASLPGDLLVLAAIILASCGYVAGGRLSTKIGAWAAITWSISLAGVLEVPLLLVLVSRAPLVVNATTLPSWAAVGYLAGCTSILGYVTWYWALSRAGVARIAPMQFIQPIISIVIAISFVGESFAWPMLVALAAIIVGMAFINRAAFARKLSPSE